MKTCEQVAAWLSSGYEDLLDTSRFNLASLSADPVYEVAQQVVLYWIDKFGLDPVLALGHSPVTSPVTDPSSSDSEQTSIRLLDGLFRCDARRYDVNHSVVAAYAKKHDRLLHRRDVAQPRVSARRQHPPHVESLSS